MKNFTLLFLLLISTLGYSQSLPFDFETTPVTADFVDFDGGTATVISNPQSGGINTSGSVAQIVRNGGQPWAGSKIIMPTNIDFTTNNSFSMKVFSPAAGIPVLFKLEVAGGGFAERTTNTTVANEWETLTWEFSGEPSNTFNEVVFIFNIGTVGDGTANSTYLFDDVEMVFIAPAILADLPITFEDPTITYDLLDFEGGGPSTIIVDATDPTNMVVQVVKDVNAGTSAGALVGGGGIANPIPFTAGNTSMSVRVWSPDAGIQVRLKVEDAGNNGISVETEATTTIADAWEILTFDFSNQVAGTAAINLANTYNKIAIFFNFGVDGATAGTKTYWYDDIQFGGGGGLVGITLPVDFESTTVNYVFGDFDGGVLTKETNPDQSGLNTSATVAKMVKNDGQPWAGSSFVLDGAIDFSVNKTFKMKVWTPAAGTNVLLKVENSGNGAINFEQEVATTTAMGWEELTFDYSAISTTESFDKIVLIFQNGTVGDGSAAFTYYVDDIELVMSGGTGSGITLPVDFESTTINYVFGDFDGGVLTKETNPDQSGLNTSATVAKMVKNDGQPWAGSSFVLDGAIDFSVNKTFKMKVWTPAAGTNVLLKVENSGNGAINFEQEVATTTAMGWEELTFDYSAISTTESFDKIVLIFQNGTVGDGSATFTYYVDDIELTMGGTTPISEVDLPITFEDTMIDYDLTDFGGNISSIVVDPTDPTNLVGQAIRSNTAETFAGTTMSDIGLANTIPFTATDTKMKVRVWSPDAGIQIRLKVENAANAGITAETEATTTVAMTWETLEFDFSNVAMGTAPYDPTQTFDKITIFFNFGVDGATAGEKTYYWDDVEFGERVTVVDIIVGSTVHTTLETAVIAAQLDDDLSGAGPFTVFAPTDDAFANLDAGVLSALLLDPTGDLAQVLLYHVLGSEVLSSGLTDGQTAPTLQGEDITVTITGGDVFINQAMVTTADIETDNGVVHIIDAVLLIPVGIEVVNAAESGIIISPNPSSEFFNIEFPEELNEKVQMTLMDVNGKILKEGVISDRISQINVNDLNTGMYFLRMDTGEVSYFQKVMVSK